MFNVVKFPVAGWANYCGGTRWRALYDVSKTCCLPLMPLCMFLLGEEVFLLYILFSLLTFSTLTRRAFVLRVKVENEI
jgi:hypothetical protein